MHRSFVLFCIVVLVHAAPCPVQAQGIDVQVIAGPTAETSSVRATGYLTDLISGNDRNAFGLDDNALKVAVSKFFGRRPNDAYLRSPTPWGDLYSRYHWAQTSRVLRVVDARILSITSQPTVLSRRTFSNNSSVKATFNTSISEEVSNTTSSTFSSTHGITIGQKFSYKVGFLGTGAKGETSLSYSHTWGKSETKSLAVTVGSSSGIAVDLAPGQSVVAELTASRGTMKVRITYEAFLSGTTAINYNPTYRGHHFWDLGIAGVMQAGGLSNRLVITQDIEIGYYSNGHVKLSNSAS